jgi:hypothetical protein
MPCGHTAGMKRGEFSREGSPPLTLPFTYQGVTEKCFSEGRSPSKLPHFSARLHPKEETHHIFRLQGGKIVERWGSFDLAGMMQQLGAGQA